MGINLHRQTDGLMDRQMVELFSLFDMQFAVQSANPGNKKPSCHKAEKADFLEENTATKKPVSANEKRPHFEKISTKIEEF